MSDGVEALGYLAGFWLFLFSARFRNAWLSDFRSASIPSRILMLLGATMSFGIGAATPAYLGYILVFSSR